MERTWTMFTWNMFTIFSKLHVKFSHYLNQFKLVALQNIRILVKSILLYHRFRKSYKVPMWIKSIDQLIKKLILYCIIFETNEYIIEMVIVWLFTVKVIVDKGRATFLKISKGRKSETAMTHKDETQKYLVDTTCQNVSCLLFCLKSRRKRDAISANSK